MKAEGMCEDKSTILPLIEQAPLSKKVKDTLLSLVDGKPIHLQPSQRDCFLVLSGEKKKTDLEHYVRAHESVGGKEIKRLMKLIKKDEDLKQKSNDLSSFLGRSKIMYKSDQSLALLCCLTQIIVTEDALNDLFRHLRGESLDKTLIESIRTEIERFRERLHDKQMHLFKRLKGAKLSWKDLAALLCLPNGGESTSLPGLKVLFPPPPPKPKKIKLRHVHQTPQKGSKVITGDEKTWFGQYARSEEEKGEFTHPSPRTVAEGISLNHSHLLTEPTKSFISDKQNKNMKEAGLIFPQEICEHPERVVDVRRICQTAEECEGKSRNIEFNGRLDNFKGGFREIQKKKYKFREGIHWEQFNDREDSG
ncbi:hypothetical protein BLNAU_23881 [Blattamonas nauphoetae]|uniref:Uncharacterized protein n=1 Tax=Blattamonas nauphoetae TaxID=2049346 RepID=A0ABQ9WNZ2_9EUKA|nr:hypothetical protein BLNAU_23881 [Blattamonas nauphoetae]